MICRILLTLTLIGFPLRCHGETSVSSLERWLTIQHQDAITYLHTQWAQRSRKEGISTDSSWVAPWEINQALTLQRLNEVVDLEKYRVQLIKAHTPKLTDQQLEAQLNILAEQFNTLQTVIVLEETLYRSEGLPKLESELQGVMERAILLIDLSTDRISPATEFVHLSSDKTLHHMMGVLTYFGIVGGSFLLLAHHTTSFETFIGVTLILTIQLMVGPLFKTVSGMFDQFLLRLSTSSDFRIFLNKLNLRGQNPIAKTHTFFYRYFDLRKKSLLRVLAQDQENFTRPAIEALSQHCR